LIFFILR